MLKFLLANVVRVKKLDKLRVQIQFKHLSYASLQNLTIINISAKHRFFGKSLRQIRKDDRLMLGTGPYILTSYKRGRHILLKKNLKWWGSSEARFEKKYNFQNLKYKIVSADNMALMMLEKGELDYLDLNVRDYLTKTNGKKWGNVVFKHKVKNKVPARFSFIGLNLQNTLFKSLKVRRALQMLIPRTLINKKTMGGLMELAIGPLYNGSDYADVRLKSVKFNPKKALKLLKEDGWKPDLSSHLLYKIVNGKKQFFQFSIMTAGGLEDYLTMFQQEAKKVGIEFNIQKYEWATMVKLLEENKHQAYTMGYTGLIDWTPKVTWYSNSGKANAMNFSNYSNPDLDLLMNQADEVKTRLERVSLLKKVYRKVTNENLYLVFFSNPYKLYGVSDRVYLPQETLNYGLGASTWLPIKNQ